MKGNGLASGAFYFVVGTALGGFGLYSIANSSGHDVDLKTNKRTSISTTDNTLQTAAQNPPTQKNVRDEISTPIGMRPAARLVTIKI